MAVLAPPPPLAGSEDGWLDVYRFIYWLCFIVLALVLLVGSLVFCPPPERVWPQRTPLLGCIPSFVWARPLGYGVFDWRTGDLAGMWEYFKERHEWLCIALGDKEFIPRESRLFMLGLELAATFSLAMVLTSADYDEEDRQAWKTYIVYLALYIHQLVLSIGLRLASIGAKAVKHSKIFRFLVFGYMGAVLSAGAIFAHLAAQPHCDDGEFCTFASYMWVFFSFEFSWGILAHPLELAIRWWTGLLFWRSTRPLEPKGGMGSSDSVFGLGLGLDSMLEEEKQEPRLLMAENAPAQASAGANGGFELEEMLAGRTCDTSNEPQHRATIVNNPLNRSGIVNNNP
mmetsp:Transcript_14005/g.45988  ORF Transcript_14005/g.45988 Transcript_14005/m.45988 type:complete len:342 (-) Transcript_14005:34-1059(-)